MYRTVKKFFMWSFILSLSISVVVLGRWAVNTVIAEEAIYQELKIFTEVLSIIKKNYVEEVEIKELIYGAARGMVNSLDPHSSFMTPDIYKEMQVDTKGEFGGLGIQIGIKKGILTVIAPIEDTPAFRAGIKAGDKILEVEGEQTKDMTLMEAVHKMRGQKGTDVTITIIREGWKETRNFTITRDIIKVKSVKHKVIEESIGYIKILQFQERTEKDLGNAIEALKEDGVDSLILDLRNNPGGLLHAAVSVSDYFLPPNKLVVYIKGRTGDKTEFHTQEDDVTENLPLVVLINQGSASASEIVSGALKDWKRALLVGTSTFGKGSVQSILPLSEGAGLRLTTAIYYTPSGVSIQSTGITPDILVKLEPKGDNENLLSVIREKDLKGHLENEETEDGEKPVDKTDDNSDDKELIPFEVKEEEDSQLRRAIEVLKTWKIIKALPDAA